MLRALCVSIFNGNLRGTVQRVVSVVGNTGAFSSLGRACRGIHTCVGGGDSDRVLVRFHTRACVRPVSQCTVLIGGRRGSVVVGYRDSTVFARNFGGSVALGGKLAYGTLTTFSAETASPNFPFGMGMVSGARVRFVNMVHTMSRGRFHVVPRMVNWTGLG